MSRTPNLRSLAVRLLATWLIAVVTLGTTMPLVWCFSGPEHSAIEWEVTPTNETANLAFAGDGSAIISSGSHDHESGCIDRQAVPVASNSAGTSTMALSDAVAPKLTLATTYPVASVSFPMDELEPDTGSAPPRFPHLKHISTVVLRT